MIRSPSTSNNTLHFPPVHPEVVGDLSWTTQPGGWQKSGMDAEFLIQGRRLRRDQIDWLGEWVATHPQWSRKRLAKELCQLWQWRNARGQLKDFAARSLLLKLHEQGHITLPPLRLSKRRSPPAAPALPDWEAPLPWSAAFGHIAPVRAEPIVPGSSGARRWAFYLHRYHYLGLRVVGENLGYLAVDRSGRDVACLLFGAPAWRCAARDRVLGWNDETRRENLQNLANNTRFLVLPWVRVPHLASHLLGQVARRIDADWKAKYAHGLEWLETFVERVRFAGTCYRAANWQRIGSTRGRGRQDRAHARAVPVKDIYLYKLGGRRR